MNSGDSPAGLFLEAAGVHKRDFNSYGSRRGYDRIMVRGTFANIRIRNQIAAGNEGGWTRHLPDGEIMSIYDAAMKYIGEGVPLVVIAGTEVIDNEGLGEDLQPRSTTKVKFTDNGGNVREIECLVRIDTPVEMQYYRNGGILPTVLRNML